MSSGMCNYLLSTENTVCPVKYRFPANMPSVFSITTDVDKMGTTPTHQASTAHSLCQSSAFSFPSQRSHNTSSKTKAETSELAIVQIQTFLSKHLNESHDSLRVNQLTPHEQRLTEAGCKHWILILLAGNSSLFLGEKKTFHIIECPYCLLNSWLHLSQHNCLIVSDKLFSNSHLLLVKLAELSVSVMLHHCSNPDSLTELPRFLIY